MDFPTRNLYRSAIEQLARGSNHTEIDIARRAIRIAQAASPMPDDIRRTDPGYYLINDGRKQFETDLGFRQSLRMRLSRQNQTYGIGGYTAAIGLLTAGLLAIPLAILAGGGIPGGQLIVLGLLGAISATDAAVALVNRTVSFGFCAGVPALALRDGVPRNLRTLIAVPTMLTTQAAIAEQIERLEIHYLASPDDNLHFAFLSDWTDADTEHAEGDEELLGFAADGIARLNQRYGPVEGGARFLLLHRRRIGHRAKIAGLAGNASVASFMN